jgi:hypothetical protein
MLRRPLNPKALNIPYFPCVDKHQKDDPCSVCNLSSSESDYHDMDVAHEFGGSGEGDEEETEDGEACFEDGQSEGEFIGQEEEAEDCSEEYFAEEDVLL